jgi:hypothetical protein
MNNRILTPEECKFIKRTPITRKFNSEKDGYKDKSYHIYAFGDQAFAVHENDKFVADFEAGDIYEVMISVSDEGWSLSNHQTFTRQQKFESAMANLTRIRAAAVVATATEAQLNALG